MRDRPRQTKINNILAILLSQSQKQKGASKANKPRGWYADILCTPIFVLGQKFDLLNICFDS